MKVALSIPNIFSYRAFLRDLAESLHALGHQTAVFTDQKSLFNNAQIPLDHFCAFYPIPFPRGMNLFGHYYAANALSKAVRSFGPDLLHAHFSANAFTVALKRKSFRHPVIATIQGLICPQITGAKRFFTCFAEAFAYRRMDSVWVLTPDDHSYLRTMIPERRAKIQRSLGFGCRLDAFDPSRFTPADLDSKRRQLGIAQQDIVFSFVGRRTHFKGFHLVVRSFLRLLRSGHNVKLLLLGGTDEFHPTGLNSDELSDLKSRPEIIDCGWISDVAEVLALSQVNVFPSAREGVPVNLMESLSLGIPVITIDSRGCRDVVRHEVDGFVLPMPTVDNIEDAMRRLALDHDLRQTFARNALAGRDRFDRRHWIREQIGIYEEIAAAKSPASVPHIQS
jgi:glycosyltransferase involved in cell wall biosynthesis